MRRKRAKVKALDGNIFEGGADLTILPCGAKPTWKKSVTQWIELFGLPTPKDLSPVMKQGDVTPIAAFPGDKQITKYIAYGAAVLNNQSSATVVERIGVTLGSYTHTHPSIRIVECVMLGTGAGGLRDEVSGKALATGFRSSAHSDAELWLWAFGSHRIPNIERAIKAGAWTHFWDSVNLKPGFFGIGVDLKKLFARSK
jgi:hypothetical protein